MDEREAVLPPVINLGIVRGTCPCNCVHCPVGIQSRDRRFRLFGKSEISLESFASFCRSLPRTGTVVRLHGVGEPTSHSRFPDLLEVIRDMSLQNQFWVFTCGIFRSSLLRPLARSVGIIEVSVNSIDAGDYLKTKGVDAFDKVKANITTLRETITSENLPSRIVLTRVSSEPVADQQFLEYWSGQGYDCFVRGFHSYSGILDVTKPATPPASTVGPRCQVPWRRFNFDGTLQKDRLTAVNCFNVLFQHPSHIPSQSILGSFPDLSLAELWQSNSLKQLRGELERHDATGTICDRCTECLTGKGPRAEDLLNGGGCQ